MDVQVTQIVLGLQPPKATMHVNEKKCTQYAQPYAQLSMRQNRTLEHQKQDTDNSVDAEGIRNSDIWETFIQAWIAISSPF
eukprot:m.25236 g.25236  ORF g.25236 m.25236 type:complete len:81 (-) comp8687_c0_seq1:2056-2298(-)